MSRSEEFHSERLYHGSSEPLKGKMVRPTRQGEDTMYAGQRVAFATNSLEGAKAYGSHVYEVEHDEHTQEGWGTEYYSEKGFRIKGKIQ